jgi:hypothetical protein
VADAALTWTEKGEEDAEVEAGDAPVAGRADPMVVPFPVHACARIQAAAAQYAPAAVGRGLGCVVSAFVEASSLAAAAAQFAFGARSP